MTTKVDNEKLDQYIGELKGLHAEWMNYKRTPLDQGDCGGKTIAEMVELTKTLQTMQDAFVSLVANTTSYMKQRQESVETKDEAAVSKIQEK